MSASTKLAAPIIESKLAAQINPTGIMIPFLMNKAVGWSEFEEMSLEELEITFKGYKAVFTEKNEDLEDNNDDRIDLGSDEDYIYVDHSNDEESIIDYSDEPPVVEVNPLKNILFVIFVLYSLYIKFI